jgi:hypothetical protein
MIHHPEIGLNIDNMAFPRVAHTTSVLSDGKVLITGGMDGRSNLKTAEIYYP